MADKTWNDFLPWVLPSCRGVPLSMARQEIRAAAIDFCEQSLCWVDSLDNVSVRGGVADYMVDPPTNDTTIAALIEVKRSGTTGRLTPGRDYTFNNVSMVLTLNPKPGGAYTLEMKAALRPARTSAGIAATIFEQFVDGIAAGAKARLLNVKGQAWSDPMMAREYASDFDDAVALARHKQDSQFSSGNTRIAWRPFGL